jgi:hypothetical protein
LLRPASIEFINKFKNAIVIKVVTSECDKQQKQMTLGRSSETIEYMEICRKTSKHSELVLLLKIMILRNEVKVGLRKCFTLKRKGGHSFSRFIAKKRKH